MNTTTAQRVIATFRDHGIQSSLLLQLQHIQELALAIQLKGDYLIHQEMFGLASGEMVFSIAGCKREDRWRVGSQHVTRRSIEIPPGGDAEALRKVQAQLADAAADLMALLREEVPA